MLYYGLAAGTVLFFAGVVWYFAGQIHYVIQDQKYEDPFFKWEAIKHYMATPLIVFYLLIVVWFIVAGVQFGLFDRITRFYDTMFFDVGSLMKAGGFTLLLVLLAALPAIACAWLEGWLEREYKNPNRERRTWGHEPHPSS